MEECEALCSSMAIMINGKFKCIGSAQHLKTRFGVGYTLSIKIKEEKHDDVERLKDYIIGNFSDAILKENHAGLLKLQLPSVVSTHDSLQNSSTKSCTLATVFKFVEETRILFPIEGYSINQTTLEEVRKENPNKIINHNLMTLTIYNLIY